ncbi:alpha/beta-hydrolase [Meredithblackwellia eburnea MCA 4105]
MVNDKSSSHKKEKKNKKDRQQDGEQRDGTDIQAQTQFEAPQDEGWGPSSGLSLLLTIRQIKLSGRTLLDHAKRSILAASIRFVIHLVSSLVTNIALAPVAFFFDPLSFFYTFFVLYPFLAFGITIFGTLLTIAKFLGGQDGLYWISNYCMSDTSIPNWLDPSIFGPEAAATVKTAFPLLEGGTTTNQPSSQNLEKGEFSKRTNRLFSLPLARTLLLFSSLVYERDDKSVDDAAEHYNKKDYELAEHLLRHNQGLTVLCTPSGPFASIFYPKSPEELSEEVGADPHGGEHDESQESGSNTVFRPWIALVFKGTSATNIAEIITDATLTRTSAGPFFGAGAVHEGFYSALFPGNTGGPDGYSAIRAHLLQHAKILREKLPADEDGKRAKVPLWITGHSLGSALAGLFFARLLHSPGDLGDDLELRDGYLYGTPRLGDAAWCNKVDENLITPLNRPNILWRIVNGRDIVTQVPPGWADTDSTRASLGISAWNFGHIGTEVHLTPRLKPFFSVQHGSFRTPTRAIVADTTPDENAGRFVSSRHLALKRNGWNFIVLLVCCLHPIFYDHFPAAYLHRLNQVDATKVGDSDDYDHHEDLSAFDQVVARLESKKEQLVSLMTVPAADIINWFTSTLIESAVPAYTVDVVETPTNDTSATPST